MERPSSSNERARAAELNRRFGHSLVGQAPDSRPAVRLRKELERDRRLGEPFEAVWCEEVEYVIGCHGLTDADADQWRTAFLATVEAWRSAYDRTGTIVSSLHGDLLLDAA